MNDSNCLTQQTISENYVGAGTYLSTDGVVKHCRTAPLLDLPVDFQEWFEPNRGSRQLIKLEF